MDDVIMLLSSVSTQDDNGVWRETLTERQVFCKVSSVTRAEFFNAGRNGLNPQYVFSVFAADYEGEELVRYNNETYSIYRTYKSQGNNYITPNLRDRAALQADYIELYAEKKGGTHGKESDN